MSLSFSAIDPRVITDKRNTMSLKYCAQLAYFAENRAHLATVAQNLVQSFF